MKNDFKKEENQLLSIVDQHFAPVLEHQIAEQIAFIESVKKLHKKYANTRFEPQAKGECLSSFNQYKKELILLVDTYFVIDPHKNFDELFPAFTDAITTYIESQEDHIVRIQGPERFISQPGDSAIVRYGKRVKRAGFAISKFPEHIGNLFRKISNKTQKPLKAWTHRINYKNLVQFYLKEILSYRLTELLKRIHAGRCSTSLQVWKADEEIVARIENYLASNEPFVIDKSVIEVSDQAIGALETEKGIIRKEITDIIGQTLQEFESAFYKAGTFELSNNHFNKSAVLKKDRNLQEETIDIEKGWMGTWQILRDDWQIDNELYWLLLSAFDAFYNSLNTLNAKSERNILTGLDEIKEYLTRSKKRIENVQDIAGQKKIIESEKEAFVTTFITQLLQEINGRILAQEFPNLIDHVETVTENLIQEIATKRSIIRNPDFTVPTRFSQISFISPPELITFESWPQLFKVIKQVKVKLVERLGDVQNSISELGQIVVFSLESALEFNAEESSGSSPGVIALEGLDRSLERLEGVRKSMLTLDELWSKDLYQGLQAFSKSLVKLTDNNNILDLRVRVAKGKALERGRLIRLQLTRKIKNFFPVITRTVILFKQEVISFVKGKFKKYGIASKSESISAEMADFLAETQLSIQKLPYVYQRLFKTEPLTDKNFFIGRDKELQSLQNAYNNWLRDRYATVIVVGEKGCGATSLLNMFFNNLSEDFPVMRSKADSCISSSNELYRFLNHLFGQDLNSGGEWVDYLNSHKKQIVVIEDIQRLYLKKVNGFDGLKELSGLISMTSKNIFWVLTCTEYAFRYLDKTILLSDNFSYLIKLELFDDRTMVDIINRRHTVSGYNIRYEPAPSDITSKKYRKLSDEEKQAVLKREYFSDLNKNVRSNISLALLYWLRSVIEVSGNNIIIRSMKDFDFSFMSSLSAIKMFVLTTLILHERLTEETLGIVLNIKPTEARRLLQPLCEDGYVVAQSGYFSVNPLLYMKTIALLKNKNIIH